MNKRIISLLVSVGVFVAILCVAIPMSASETNIFILEADKSTASPGETIKYTLFLQNPRDMTAFGFNIVLPEGLYFVENSETLNTEKFGETLEFVPDNNYQLLWYSLEGDDFTERTKIEIMRFECEVNENATIGSTYSVTLNNVLEAAGKDEEYKNISAEVSVQPHALSIVEKAPGYTVHGTITSYLDNTDITVQLLDTSENVVASTVVTGYTGSGTITSEYSFPEVADGEYIMRVSKVNHVTRDYTVTVSGDTVADASIHPIGDANLNGSVNLMDYNIVLRHVKKLALITDDYALKCADANENGNVNLMDYNVILRHVKKLALLWE